MSHNAPVTAAVLSLPEVAAGSRVGTSSPADALAAFLAATVYCEAPPAPGVVPATTPTGPVVCVHSSLAELAAARGAVPWFATTGQDLLDLLPAGHDLLLDPASEHVLRLRPAALRHVARVS